MERSLRWSSGSFAGMWGRVWARGYVGVSSTKDQVRTFNREVECLECLELLVLARAHSTGIGNGRWNTGFGLYPHGGICGVTHEFVDHRLGRKSAHARTCGGKFKRHYGCVSDSHVQFVFHIDVSPGIDLQWSKGLCPPRFIFHHECVFLGLWIFTLVEKSILVNVNVSVIEFMNEMRL